MNELDWITPPAEQTEADILRERIAHLNRALYVVQCYPTRAAEFAPLLDLVHRACDLESSDLAVRVMEQRVGWTQSPTLETES